MTKATLIRVTTLAGALTLAMLHATTGAEAFWQRSQVSNCADATTEAELLRWRCSELGAYADPGWPDFGQFHLGRGKVYSPGLRRAVPGGVARRLG